MGHFVPGEVHRGPVTCGAVLSLPRTSCGWASPLWVPFEVASPTCGLEEGLGTHSWDQGSCSPSRLFPDRAASAPDSQSSKLSGPGSPLSRCHSPQVAMHTHNPARARTLAPGSVENIVSGSTHLFFFFFFSCAGSSLPCAGSLVAVSRGYSPAAVLGLLTVVASLVEGL